MDSFQGARSTAAPLIETLAEKTTEQTVEHFTNGDENETEDHE
jgi:hypothetical protein